MGTVGDRHQVASDSTVPVRSSEPPALCVGAITKTISNAVFARVEWAKTALSF